MEETPPAPEPKDIGDMLDELLEERGVSPHVEYPAPEAPVQAVAPVFQPALDPEPEFEAEPVFDEVIAPAQIPEQIIEPEQEAEPEQEEPEQEDDLLPDYFDTEVEAEPEPQPQSVDSFAAVENKDDIDDLFKDEDDQRRQSALEEEPVSASKRLMSWAGAAFGKLAAARARAQEEVPAQQQAQQPAPRRPEPQPHAQQPSSQNDPLADYSLNETTAAQADPLYDEPQERYSADNYDDVRAAYQDEQPEYQQYEAYEEPAAPAEPEAPVAPVVTDSLDESPYASSMNASMRASAARTSNRSLRENQLSLDMPVEEERDPGFSQVLVINVMARPNSVIYGDELLQVLLGAGLRFGDMSIFHRHADRKGGPVLFSVANALNPGTFDLNRISDFTTQGICFFMTLPNVANNMLAFEQMLATAKHAQQALDAELKDDNRSVMTAQTVEHYRQRIRDFELQQFKNSRQK